MEGASMIVLRTLAHGVISHAGVRFTEWLGAVPLLGIGYVLFAQPGAFETSPSFVVLSKWAEQAVWSNIILAVGIARLLALGINGSFRSFPHSPAIRFLASWAACIFWALFTMGIYVAWRDAGGSPTGIAAYGTLVILELRNAYDSRADMVVAKGKANARTNG